MYVNVSERFTAAVDFLIKTRRLRNQAELTEILDLSKGYVSQIVTGKREPSDTVVSKFANLFPEINSAWLLTGEGDMLLSQGTTQHVSGSNNTAVSGGNVVRIGNISGGDGGEGKGSDTLKAENDLLRSENESLRRQNERLLEIVAAAMGAAK